MAKDPNRKKVFLQQTVKCPHCNVVYERVSPSLLGRIIPCKQCGQKFQVPEQTPPESCPAGAVNASAGAAVSWTRVSLVVGGFAGILLVPTLIAVILLVGASDQSPRIARHDISTDLDLDEQAAPPERQTNQAPDHEAGKTGPEKAGRDAEPAPAKGPAKQRQAEQPEKEPPPVAGPPAGMQPPIAAKNERPSSAETVPQKEVPKALPERKSEQKAPKKNFIPPFIPEKEIVARVKKAGGKVGKVTISLAWQNYNDLDLHVLTSQGERISYQNRRSRCGGQLDVDQNVSPTTTTPVENIYWLESSPPKGPLKIYVHHYRNHRLRGCQDPTRFVVRAQVGDVVKVYQGRVSFSGSFRPTTNLGTVLVATIDPQRFQEAGGAAPVPPKNRPNGKRKDKRATP